MATTPSTSHTFGSLCDRQKRRRTEYLKQFPQDHIDFTAKKALKSDAQFVFDFLQKYPEHAQKIRKFCESMLEPEEKTMSKEKALSVLVAADLSKYQYNVIRNQSEKFPSYYQIQKAKSDCYPAKDTITITESLAKVKLQSVLNQTSTRLIDSLNKPSLQNKNCVLFSKWGCDGASDQAQYNMTLSNNESDNSVFVCSFVPIKLCDANDNNCVFWKNDYPSSTRYCRPIQFHFAKEDDTIVKRTVAEIQQEIAELLPTKYEDITVSHILSLTMIDGKIINIMTDTKSSMRCYLCNSSPKDMNNLDLVKNKTVNKNNLSYGISSLHAWIRCFECLLHIAYNLPFKSWSAKTTEQKALKNERKIKIQNNFRIRTGLLVDVIKQGKGTTNTGNTARKFFADPKLSAEITGLNEELINSFGVILKTIACGEKINTEKFRSYCLEVAEKFIDLYGWFYMPVSVHKILIHGADIIQEALLPIGQLSEEAQEANHKLMRSYRENHSRKISRKASNEDVFRYLLLASDPLITNLRPKLNCKNQDLSEAVIELLDIS